MNKQLALRGDIFFGADDYQLEKHTPPLTSTTHWWASKTPMIDELLSICNRRDVIDHCPERLVNCLCLQQSSDILRLAFATPNNNVTRRKIWKLGSYPKQSQNNNIHDWRYQRGLRTVIIYVYYYPSGHTDLYGRCRATETRQWIITYQ